MTESNLPPLLPFGHSLWAIRQDVLPRLIEAHRTSHSPELAELARAITPRAASTVAGTSGGVAIVPLSGVITPRGSLLSMLFGGGGGGLHGFRAAFREAMRSDVGTVVIDIDSPGGLVSLVPETAKEIREARGDKRIVAVSNTMAASAAYWIGSQADELVVTPSGETGSIGVYAVHEDWSKFNADFGVDVTYITAGKFKAEGNPDNPLSEAASEQWQAEIDEIHSEFIDAVAEGRGVPASEVAEGYGEGRALRAEPSLEAGLVDRIAPMEQVLSELVGVQIEPASDPAEARALQEAAEAARTKALADELVDEPDDDEPKPELSDDERTRIAVALLG